MNDFNNKNYGELIQVDMIWGYAVTDGIYIYLFVLHLFICIDI